jgi:hypothetical protein
VTRRRHLPALYPLTADEPLCGAPAPRKPFCEAWCTTSPFAPFAASLSSTGSGCWEPPAIRGAISLHGRRPPRVLLYTGYNGLSDSLVGAVAAFYLAILADAEFHMRFSGDAADPSFLWAFEPNCIDALSTVWSSAKTTSLHVDGFPEQRTFQHFDFYHVPDTFLRTVKYGDLAQLWAGNEVLSVNTHLGFTHHLLRNPRYANKFVEMGITAQNAFAEAYHFLLRPRDAGLHRFRRELTALLEPTTTKIGIHVRAGVHYDKVFEPGAPPASVSNFTPFFTCAQRVEESLLAAVPLPAARLPRVQWFLISDSVSLRESAARLLSNKLLPRSEGINVRHTRTSTFATPVAANSSCLSFLDAAMEHWLFGLADAHVVTLWSGFGRTGAMLHMPTNQTSRKLMFQLSATEQVVKDCSPVNAATLEDILEHPPGI